MGVMCYYLGAIKTNLGAIAHNLGVIAPILGAICDKLFNPPKWSECLWDYSFFFGRSLFKNAQVLPFFVESSHVRGDHFFFGRSRGQKPTFGSNQNTFGRNHATFVCNQTTFWEQPKYFWEESVQIFKKLTFVLSGLRLRPCLAGLLPDIFPILGAKKNIWEEHVNVWEDTVTRWEQSKHIWEQSKHTWEQSKHIWEQSKHI